MKTRAIVSPDSKPALPRGVRLKHDDVRRRMVLLAPERVLHPDPPSVAILSALDGQTTLREIARRLAGEFDAPAEEILGDATSLLQDLADAGFVRP